MIKDGGSESRGGGGGEREKKKRWWELGRWQCERRGGQQMEGLHSELRTREERVQGVMKS
jgi:hypothetical protein